MTLFQKFEKDDYTVFKDKSKLSLSYAPPVLVARRREEEYFAKILTRGVKENYFPPMIRVSGPPGSGKTVVVKSVLDRFSKYRGDVFWYFYVNLKGSRTVFMAANAVLSAISGRKVPSNLGLDRVFDEIWLGFKALKEGGHFVCLVLDEVESFFMDKHYDPSDFFYRFLRYQTFLDEDIKLCLIVIANNLSILEEGLDARVRSSMGNESIRFHPYTIEELEKILHNRIDETFKEGAIEINLAQFVSWLMDRSYGDARKAIDLLRVCGEVANERKGKIRNITCVNAADRMVMNEGFNVLENLQIAQVAVLAELAYLLKSKGRITSGDLYDFHAKTQITNKLGVLISPLSRRSVLNALNYFESLGLLRTWNVSQGRRGYGKEIRLNINPDSLLRSIKAQYGLLISNARARGEKIINDKHSTEEVNDNIAETINNLISADRQLAENTYAQASINSGDKKVDHELEKAQEYLEKANEELNKISKDGKKGPKYHKVIDQLKKSWKHSQKALKHAEKLDQ